MQHVGPLHVRKQALLHVRSVRIQEIDHLSNGDVTSFAHSKSVVAIESCTPHISMTYEYNLVRMYVYPAMALLNGPEISKSSL